MAIVPQAVKAQKANTTKATRAKAKRLEVVDLTARYAFVAGDHGTYCIWFADLRCTCQAAGFDLHCSHVAAALRERGRLRGCSVAFLRDGRHADSYAAMQRGRGRTATVHAEHGWFWVESAPAAPPSPPPDTPVASFAQIQADADELFA